MALGEKYQIIIVAVSKTVKNATSSKHSNVKCTTSISINLAWHICKSTCVFPQKLWNVKSYHLNYIKLSKRGHKL